MFNRDKVTKNLFVGRKNNTFLMIDRMHHDDVCLGLIKHPTILNHIYIYNHTCNLNVRNISLYTPRNKKGLREGQILTTKHPAIRVCINHPLLGRA